MKRNAPRELNSYLTPAYLIFFSFFLQGSGPLLRFTSLIYTSANWITIEKTRIIRHLFPTFFFRGRRGSIYPSWSRCLLFAGQSAWDFFLGVRKSLDAPDAFYHISRRLGINWPRIPTHIFFFVRSVFYWYDTDYIYLYIHVYIDVYRHAKEDRRRRVLWCACGRRPINNLRDARSSHVGEFS